MRITASSSKEANIRAEDERVEYGTRRMSGGGDADDYLRVEDIHIHFYRPTS
jgi:hypothetical protein